MPSAAATSTLTPALGCGAPIITAGNAVSRQLRQAFDAAQRARGLAAWEPAPFLSWDQWLDSLWSDAIVAGAETRLLLNQAQEHSLWAGIVSSTAQPDLAPTDVPLTSADALADLARNAWNLAGAHNATARLRSSATTHDARIFADWADSFARECKRRDAVSRAGLEAALAQHIVAANLSVPPQLNLVGFADFTPAQQTLLDAFRAAGAAIQLHPSGFHPAPQKTPLGLQRNVLRAASEQEELHALAHWIRNLIEQKQSTGQIARVGVLLPNLDADRDAVESVFREVLAPELQAVGCDISSAPYEFATGRPLASFPLIAVALDLARWTLGALPLGRVSALLLSPYLRSFSSHNQSAQFDACALRQMKLLRPEIDLAALLQLARTSPYGDAPLLWLQPLAQFLQKSGDLASTRTFADWAEFLGSLAAAANWPGKRQLTSHEFHATRAWDDALDSLATLDFRGQRVPFREALRALEQQVATARFNPPPTGATVQLFSPELAQGLSFDALVLARATDANYPVPEHTNPLLGFSLQAGLDMPGANRDRAAARAEQSLANLLAASHDILISYAAEIANGPQRLAPAFARLDWPQQDAANLLAPAPAAPIEEELVEDSDPLPPLPSSSVHGGARLLQLQAACGFRAFAEMRLGAREPDRETTGFDAREMGNLLHRALDKFWKRVRSQENLRAMSSESRAAMLSRCIDESIDTRLRVEAGWDQAYLALQQERLLHLLEKWLDFEEQRGPFEIVEVERDESIPLGPLDLRLRIDRIDRVKDGVFLVDYKTGYAAKPDQWDGPRPDEPQLPLYALLPEAGDLRGLAFAKIRVGKDMKWLGLQAEPGLIPGKADDEFHSRIEQWRSTLTTLAEDFARGDAGVRPKEYPHTCTHCAQRLLCRLEPASLLASADDEGDTTEERHDG